VNGAGTALIEVTDLRKSYGDRDLAEAGTTMVLATHEMSFARDVATTVCFLDGGRILEQGPPSTMLVAPEQERTRQFLRRVLPRTG
jgi:polar amino acid transport system ATP-binding protein